MASFVSVEDICEGNDCEATSCATHYVKERRGFYCEKHNLEIVLYCKIHGVLLCTMCALIHQQQESVPQVILDAIEDTKAKLNALKTQAQEEAKEKAQEEVKSYFGQEDKILKCQKDINAHLQAAKDGVDGVIHELTEINMNREQEDATKINLKFDEKNKKLVKKIQKIKDEIRRNEKERKNELELNKITAEKRQEPIDNRQHILHTDIQSTSEDIKRKIGELEKLFKDYKKTTEKTKQKFDTVMENQDDQSEVRDKHQLEWKLINKINVRDVIDYPVLVGFIDERHMIITDKASGNAHTYMMNIKTGHTQRVIPGRDTSWITSCALLNDDKIQDHVVCGKNHEGCTGDCLTGYSVYNSQWKLINDVTRNTTLDAAWVDVAVDHEGMVISAEFGQSKIYVTDPADGKIINTITCKENMKMLGVLSSGHIIARPSPADRRVFIINREGAHREIPHSDVIRNACIDPIKNDLYVVTSDDGYKTCVIDLVMSGGDMKKRRVASFPLSTRLTEGKERRLYLSSSRLIMMPSGEMIACDGDNILIFVKELFSI